MSLVLPQAGRAAEELASASLSTGKIPILSPTFLRRQFHEFRLRDLHRYVRVGAGPLVILSIGLTLITSWLMRGDLVATDRTLWIFGSSFLCSLIIFGAIGAQFSGIRRRYGVFVGCLATLALTKLAIVPQLFESSRAATVESYFCMLSIIIITLSLKLSLISATVVCISAAALSLILCYTVFDVTPDLGMMFYYYVAATCVCLFVAMLREQQEIKNFYQAILISRDAREREVLNQELSRIAHQDALSGLANRRHFDLALDREWHRLARESGPLAVLFIDIDHFKLFNDRYGHGAGDACLRQIGIALDNSLRRPGDLAARYGGEEFVILLPATDKAGAMDVAHRVLEEIDALKIPHYASSTGSLTASVGLALCIPDPMQSPETLLHLADTALYNAKHSGRHQVVAWTEVDENNQPSKIR